MKIAIGNACVDGIFIDSSPFAACILFLSPWEIPLPRHLPQWERGAVASSCDAPGLMRRENYETKSFINQRLNYSIVARGFRQPEAFGLATKSKTKISETPPNLRSQIMVIAKRQDRMSVSLRDCISVT